MITGWLDILLLLISNQFNFLERRSKSAVNTLVTASAGALSVVAGTSTHASSGALSSSTTEFLRVGAGDLSTVTTNRDGTSSRANSSLGADVDG